MIRAALICGAAMIGSTATAEGFSIEDFGMFETRDACMAQVQKTLNRYTATIGLPDEIDVGIWTIIAWDLEPGKIDVVFSCPEVGGTVNAFVHAYNADNDGDDNRRAAVAALREIFESAR